MRSLEEKIITFDNSLRLIFMSTAEQNEYFQNQLERNKIAIMDANGNFRNLEDIMKDLAEQYQQVLEDNPAGDNQKDRKPKWESDLENFGGIYGYMYGYRSENIPLEEDITFIPKDCLQIGKYKDCFIYVWGWPGPDANIYDFKDYGKTWSFNKKDLKNNVVG